MWMGIVPMGGVRRLCLGPCLKEYVERMKEDQGDIFYITVRSITPETSSPFLDTRGTKSLRKQKQAGAPIWLAVVDVRVH